MSVKTVAIVSDNLAGLILAAKLEQAGLGVILIHTDDGACDSLSRPQLRAQALPSLTFENNVAKPFVGFGESKKPSVQALSRYNVTLGLSDISSASNLTDLSESLKNIQGQRHFFSELGEFQFNGEIIEKLPLNVGQAILADHFIFMNSPLTLLPLLHSELVGARTRGRIAKTPIFTEIALVLEHKVSLHNEENLIFLVPNNDQNDQVEPIVGQFTRHQTSVWLAYVKDELCEDSEYVSTVIKNMRRQIRKSFSLNEDPATVSLTVTAQSFADFSWLAEQKDVALIAKNLTICPTLSSSFTGIAQQIDAAETAFAQIQRITVDLSRRHVLDPVL